MNVRVFTIEEYRSSNDGLTRARVVVYRIEIADDERMVLVRVGTQYYPVKRYLADFNGMQRESQLLAAEKSACRAYARKYHPEMTVLAGLRHRAKVTATHAKKITGLTHPMAAMDKLREMLTEHAGF